MWICFMSKIGGLGVIFGEGGGFIFYCVVFFLYLKDWNLSYQH